MTPKSYVDVEFVQTYMQVHKYVDIYVIPFSNQLFDQSIHVIKVHSRVNRCIYTCCLTHADYDF